MVSEMVETKLPRLCHARRLQLSEQTVDARPNYKLPSIGRSTGRSIPRHNAFYGIGVSRFPFPVSRRICLSFDSMDDFRRTGNALVGEPRR